MSIESMRVGGGRCPPFLVVGLVIACFMMICNWWTLSSTNIELIHQIEELNEQIRISAEDRDQCVTQTKILESQLKSCQEEKKDKARSVHEELIKLSDKLSTCNTELDSYKQNENIRSETLKTFRMNNKALEEDKKKLEAENKRTKEELEKLKLSQNVPPQRLTSAIPQAGLIEKPQVDNKAENKSALQANEAQNAPILEAPDPQDNSANKEDNAAEINDVQDLNLNFLPDGNKMKEIKK